MALRDELIALLDKHAPATPQNVENEVLATFMERAMKELGYAMQHHQQVTEDRKRRTSQ